MASSQTAVEGDREYRSLIHAELGFEADGGVAPEWLPQERLHDSGRQSNAAVDIRLKVARVGDNNITGTEEAFRKME